MDADTARKLLTDERDRLAPMLEAVRGDVESQKDSMSELSSIDQHPGDLGSDTFEREKDMAIAGSVEESLAEVDAALRRLDDGSYGRCEVDGEPIPDERLQALPAARYCVRHRAELEDRTEA